jgi:signal transduction histidine kinase
MERMMQSQYVFWGGSLIMFVFSLSVVAFIAFYKSRLAKIRKEETEYLLNATMELENKERKRIAADLHDSICGDLGAIRNYLAILEQGNFDDSAKAIIYEIKESVSTVLQNTKEISYNMMPPLIETFGLAAAVEEYIRRIRKMHAVELQLRCASNGTMGLCPLAAYEIYRILQELLTNTLKYGDVTWVVIEITDHTDWIFINITDDGKPFLIKEQLRLAEGLGVKNIFSRLSYIDGHLQQFPRQNGNELNLQVPKQHI